MARLTGEFLQLFAANSPKRKQKEENFNEVTLVAV
jgi:hypothetical protein